MLFLAWSEPGLSESSERRQQEVDRRAIATVVKVSGNKRYAFEVVICARMGCEIELRKHVSGRTQYYHERQAFWYHRQVYVHVKLSMVLTFFPFHSHKLSLTLLLPVFQVEIVRHKLGGVRRVLRQSSGSIPSWLAICLTNRPIIIRGSNTPHGHVYAVSQPSKWRETSARMYSIQQKIIYDRCLYAEWRISEAQLSRCE